MKRYMPLFALCVLVLGGCISWYIIQSKPRLNFIRPSISMPLVSVSPMTRGDTPLHLSALGIVTAAQSTSLQTEVSGKVIRLGEHFELGAFVQQGELIIEIDGTEYKNSLTLKQSALASAQADYDIEMGQQRVAKTEIEQLKKKHIAAQSIDTTLALREPYLAKAKANVVSAKADVDQAIYDLERTKLFAPYNAIVVARNVSLGSQASSSVEVAQIVGTDHYYVEASIPMDKLNHLGLTSLDGTEVQMVTSSGTVRTGEVLHSIAHLDDTTRMARLLVSVSDPLGLNNGQLPIFLNDHVRITLQAGLLKDVLTIPRSSIRGNDTVWIAVPSQGEPNKDVQYKLDIRPVTVVWKDSNELIVQGDLHEGELLITSPLGGPLQGMPLRVREKSEGKSVTTEPLSEDERGAGRQGRPSGMGGMR